IEANRTELRRSYRTHRDRLGRDGIDYDDRYCWYCYRLMAFRDGVARLLRRKPESLSLRVLDVCLYGLHDTS
ncbi:MAG: hypothetical protein QME96_10460, partial [Myxococcota bacterium]|nr:hypothetical protein [Myxococcota bacterium]